MSFLIKSTVCLPVASESTYYPRRMSNSALTSEAQLRYILQWFGEFSELQREDFLPILAAAHAGKPEQLAATLASLSCDDKPVSLFQCRIKLFNEWFPTWAEEERDRLIKAVSEVDCDFGTKLQDALVNGVSLNGNIDDSDIVNSEAENLRVEEDESQGLEDNNGIHQPVVSQENVAVEIAAAS